MQIMIDTREKQHAIKRILSEFEKHGIQSISSKLYVGDYMSLDNPRLIIDRKAHRLPDEPVYDLDLLVDAMLMSQGRGGHAVSIANTILPEFVNTCRELHASAWIIRTAPNEQELSLFDAAGAVYIDLPCTIERAMERRPAISEKEMKQINERYEHYRNMREREESGERW